MVYRDLSSALARIARLEAELADLRPNEERRRATRWFDLGLFALLVLSGAVVIVVISWLYNAS